jgi:RNA polymerase sigma-70 factor, ECF subfamily
LVVKALIDECRNGNMSGFRKLIEQTTPFVFAIAFRMLGDEEKAKDTVQDTLVTVWQKINTVKSPEAYKTWVGRIVMNKCYDQLRRSKSNPEFTTDDYTWQRLSETIEDASDVLGKKETAQVIALLTSRLSPRQKAVFVLSEIDQMTAEEVASITGISKAAVKANLYYARKNISELVSKYL